MKDTRTILLLAVSLCLVGTWVYHLYDKNKYAAIPAVELKKDEPINQTAINDSIRLKFSTTLTALDSARMGKDSLHTELSGKLTEIDSLRNEIASILNISNITREDLRRAEDKIKQLQQKMQVASKPNNATSTNLVNNNNGTVEITPQQEIKTTAPEKKEAVPSFLNALNISFRAIQADAKEQITSKAAAAGYFSISYSLQNNNASFTDTEVYMVLTDGAGNVIQDDQWQGGMFQSKDNVRMAYTRKNNFSYTKGDAKRISMNIKLPSFEQGSYSVQIYHNGLRIGKTYLRLN